MRFRRERRSSPYCQRGSNFKARLVDGWKEEMEAERSVQDRKVMSGMRLCDMAIL